LGNPGAGHVAEVNIKLEQARWFLQLLGQQADRRLLGLIRRADHDLPDDFAIQIHGQMLFEAVESFGAALAAVAPVRLLNGEASVWRNVRRDPPATRPPVRIGFGVLGD
jgi:hypothetical protein